MQRARGGGRVATDHRNDGSLAVLVSSDTPTDDQPVPCSPCRGTGRVISNLGGSPSEETCPWCDGTGVIPPGHDAQARWRDGAADAG